MAQKCFLKANEKICVKSVRQILSRCPLCPPHFGHALCWQTCSSVCHAPFRRSVCLRCAGRNRDQTAAGGVATLSHKCRSSVCVCVCVLRRLINYCFKGNSSVGGGEGGVAVVICLLSIFAINIRGAAKYAAATCLAYLMAYFSACPDIFECPAANCVQRVCRVRQLAWKWDTF